MKEKIKELENKCIRYMVERDRARGENEVLQEKITKLNNIIDELEKELKECYEEYKDVEHIELRTSALEDLAILNRIKELKEGKDND